MSFSEHIVRRKVTAWFDLAIKYKEEFDQIGREWESHGYWYVSEIGVDAPGLWYVELVVYKDEE